MTLHKGTFGNALALRYRWTPANLPTHCACGVSMSVEHVLSCPKGGLPNARHNEVRDTIAGWMSEVCNNTTIEPTLQPISGETLSHASAISEDGPHLDIAADGFWGVLMKELSSTFVCSILFLPQIPASPLLPPIVNMRNANYGLTNREYGKLSMDRSRH